MDYQQLESLFISNPSQAIEECKKIICSVSQFESYEDFKNYHIEHKKVSNCEENLFSPQLNVLCFTCSKNHSFAVCLSCFLKGNHEGHYYMILPRFSGHCACGDDSIWKQSGCCSEHSHPPEDHPESYIEDKIQKIFTELIFKASITALTKLTTKNDDKVQIIIQFIATFLQFGDGFYRLLVIVLTEKVDFKNLLKNVSEYSSIFNQLLNALCLYCFHDKVFKKSIELATYSNLNDKYLSESIEVMLQNKKDDHYQVWESFWSQVFTSSQFQYNIENCHWDWVSLFVNLSKSFKEIIGFVGNPKCKASIPCYFKTLVSDVSLITKIQPNEETQNLFDSLFTQVFCCGTSSARKNTNNINVVASFKPNRPENYYIPIFTFQLFYPKFFRCFKSKPNLKFDSLINQLDKLITLTSIYRIGLNLIGKNEENKNEKFVQKFFEKETRNSPNLFYYKSFHNGGSFFINLPLYDSLVSLFRNDNLSRIKIAKFLCLKKYQKLRVKLGIITLKKILSFVCFHQHFVPKSNFGVNFVYNQFDHCLRTTHTISRYFSLFQLLIGLECNEEIVNNKDYEFSLKEYFAFELAREIGLFDDFECDDDYKDENVNEIKEKMFFSFLYISLLIVVERTLFNLNSFNYVHEQTVFALKKGVSRIDKLHGCYDIEAFNVPEVFPLADKILSKISTTSKNDEAVDQDIYYYLKDDVEWNSLSAINSFNDQKTLLIKEISKNPTKLLKIQDFQNEDEYFFRPRKSVYEIEEGLSDDVDESEYNLDNLDLSDVKVRLKKFLLTPTVLAVVYYCLRTNSGVDSSTSGINDHLAMNILVLVSKFVFEDDELNSNLVDLTSEIHFESLSDLISKLQVSLFSYKVDENDNAFVSNNLNKKNFINFLKVKISSDSLPPKSFIDVLLSKGELGRNVIDQMSINDQIEIENQPTEEDEKMKKKLIAKAKKQAILEQFSKNQSKFSIQKENHSSSIDQASVSNDVDSDCCSVCGSAVIDDLSYPVYFYRTKVPFIVDKPPFVNLSKSENLNLKAVDDDDDDDELHSSNEEEEKSEFDYSIPADQTLRTVLARMPNILNFNGLSPEEIDARKRSIEDIKNQILMKYAIHEIRVSKKEKKAQKLLHKKDDQNELKRCTVGANYIIQFGICPHPIHPQCVKTEEFKCPLCKAYKNGFLPYIDSIPKHKLFLNGKVVDGSQINSNSLADKFVHSISLFIEKFKSFLSKTDNVFIELIKSISGLIVTYEIRLRNIKKCLDSSKTFDLSRNLFLAAWFAYRIEGKPPIIDDETKFTTFQRYVKRLIENDSILDDDFDKPLNLLVSEFLNTLKKEKTHQNLDAKLKSEVEKEVFLFLRRVSLSDFFLLDKSDVQFENDSINWTKILSQESICQKYGVEIEGEFVLNSLQFTKMPINYFDFSKSPFNFPIEKVGLASMFSFLDYNHLISHFENFCEDCRENSIDSESEVKRMKSALLSVDKDKLQFYFRFDYGEKICPSVIFYVGGDATKVVVVDGKLVAILKPFYFNLYDCPDVGFTSLQPLKLNEKSYKRFMDEVLSGDFSYNLETIMD